MRKCLIKFAKNSERHQFEDIGSKPKIKYMHICQKCKIGLIVTPHTEANLSERLRVLDKTCRKHCPKLHKALNGKKYRERR